MAWSISDRRRLGTWLGAVLFGGLVGYGYMFVMPPLMDPAHVGEPTAREALKGFRTGAVIAGLAVGFELYGMRTALGSWLRRLSFLPAFLIREAILAGVVIISLLLNAAFSRWVEGAPTLFAITRERFSSILCSHSWCADWSCSSSRCAISSALERSPTF